METEVIEYTLPEWTLPALINGDLSGLANSEIDALDALHVDIDQYAGNRPFHWSIREEDPYFAPCNDLPGLHGNEGSNVAEVDLVYMGEGKKV